MIRLSVNVNKVATLRNSRGGAQPDVVEAVRACVDAGARGITVHPRADERHIRPDDVRAIAAELRRHAAVELNIEGDPRPDLLDLVREVQPHQCTLVPVRPGEITSLGGWPPGESPAGLRAVVDDLRGRGIRVSVFVDADPAAVRWATHTGADRIELYTEPFARAYEQAVARPSPGAGEAQAAREILRAIDLLDPYRQAGLLAHELGLGVNAGHDLDLDNLRLFRTLPHLDEVSIGHALVSRALLVGLDRVVREYLAVLQA